MDIKLIHLGRKPGHIYTRLFKAFVDNTEISFQSTVVYKSLKDETDLPRKTNHRLRFDSPLVKKHPKYREIREAIVKNIREWRVSEQTEN